MTPGLSTYVFFDQRLRPGLLDALAAAGASTIEVFAARHHFDYTDLPHVRETAAWFRSNDVRAILHQPIYLTDGSRTFAGGDPGQWSRHVAPNLNLISDRKNARIAAMDEVKRALEAAEQVPFSAGVLHLGLRDTEWDDYAIEHSITAIEHLKAFAGPLGMKLMLENLQNDVSTPQHLVEILTVGHFDNVGIALDLGHLHLTTEATQPDKEASRDTTTELGLTAAALEKTIATVGRRLGAIHVHDNHGPFGAVSSPSELHDEHLWPGEGTIAWGTVQPVLAALAPTVAAIVEPAPIRDMPPAEVTSRAQAAFRRVLDPAQCCIPDDTLEADWRPMQQSLRGIAAGMLLAVTVAAGAQQVAPETGYWRAENQTARSITGDIAFSGDHLTINFLLFTIARIRALESAEVEAAFHPDPGTQGAGSLYRLQVPASRKFLRKNTLCGSDDTQWMVTWVTGRSLEIDFFSGQNPPRLTSEALSNTSDLCGTYTYIR